VLVRRERAHPGAQLTFTDLDGHRFQAILTDQTEDIAELERDHRGRARVEDHIRNDKDTGLRNLPFRDFEHNRVWLEIVRIAHDLIAWTQRLLLSGELAKSEPKRCATDCCTSPPASPSTPAPPRCVCRHPGPGRPTSPPPSTSSKRSPGQPDAGTAGTRDDHLGPARSAPRSLPANEHRDHPRRPRSTHAGLNWPHPASTAAANAVLRSVCG